MASSTIVVVVTSGRKCGACGECGHDRRNCNAKPTAVGGAGKPKKVIDMANHYSCMSHKLTGPVFPTAYLTDPVKYWATVGADVGAYPFQRDAKGCMHYPAEVLSGGCIIAHEELKKMKEYTWDSAAKVFRLNCACPGCV
jgi:hypothetical protein